MMRMTLLSSLLVVWMFTTVARAEDAPWRSIPLIENGKVAKDWIHIGYGSFAVDEGALRTDNDEKGMGMLLYKKEKLGDCQIRVVYKTRDAKSNGGVFIRIDDGILEKLGQNAEPVQRGKDGKLSKEMLQKLMDASEKELGAWWPVHHGYEVQICDIGDDLHRTGAIYSLAKAAPIPKKEAGEWRTMIITLDSNTVKVEVEGKLISTFDPDGKDVPAAKNWTEPKREHKRPKAGYIGLQNHDPGDVVHYKEISVRPIK